MAGTTQRPTTEWLTVTEAAQQAGTSRSTVSGWITSGLLPVVRIDGRRYVHLEDLAAAQARAHEGAVVPAWRDDPRRAGTRLRARREAAGLSQLQLSAASGVTHEAISNLETGKRSPFASTVRALAQALGIHPERLIARETTGLSLLTVAQAAARLDVPPARVRAWVTQGELAGTKVSGQWRVPAVLVVELERSGRLRGRSRRLDPRYHG
jgi:excisionase family DNA binding protein